MGADSYTDTDGGPGRTGRLLALAYVGFIALLFAALGGIAYFGRASDGEPVAHFDMPSAPAKRAVPVRPAAVSPVPRAAGPFSPQQTTLAPGTPPVPVPPQLVPQVVSKPVIVGRDLVADPALIEQTAAGPLPRIGADGRMPMSAYAPPLTSVKGPRIAIVISGLGISAKATAAAIQALPPAVTLAFAPYESDVQRWVAEARRQGHEVLLEVPMEPFDFPDSDPGPHTLRASAGEETNTERLQWSLTRFTGYAGITNLLGGRFMSDADSLEPVMTYVARRGLLFFDSGPQNHSVAPDVAHRIDAAYVQSAITLDTIQAGMEIDARLSELEKLARANGSAAGSGFIFPVTVERVANWAKGLEGRGFVLVPASAIVAPSR